MSAGQARHVRRRRPDGVRRGRQHPGRRHRLRPGLGAYPTPYPVLTTAADRHVLPRAVPGAQGQLQLQVGVLEHRGLAAYRGPWQYETLAREILLDIAARKMGMDPVELRRRNLLRGDEMPYFNPNGMPYDHVAPADTFEQAVKILDHEGFRKEQQDALDAGPLHRARLLGRTSSRPARATGHLGDRGRDDPDGADRQDQRLRQRRIDRQQHRDHGRPADRRRARRRHRRRRRRSRATPR